MNDLISRQAAIDIERNATVDTNPMHFEAHQKFTQFMDDAEISSFGRWQWSNGFNTALTAVGIDLKKLPPIQPNTDLQNLAEEIAAFKRSFKSANSDYFTGYMSALSLVEGMIAEREVTE